MERWRKLKHNVGGQWETRVHPLAAFVPPISLLCQREQFFRYLVFPTGMSMAKPTPFELYRQKYTDFKQLFTLIKCHVICNLYYPRNLLCLSVTSFSDVQCFPKVVGFR